MTVQWTVLGVWSYKEETFKEIKSFLPNSVTILSDKTEQEYEIDFITLYKFAVPVFIS